MLDVYLKIDGIEGEARDSKHKGWIQLESFNHSIANDATGQSVGGHHTGGRCHHGEVQVVKACEGSSPNLYLACCKGKSHPNAVVEFMRSGGSGDEPQCYQRIEFTDVVITGVRPFASGGSEFPQEEVTFAYGTIKWTHTKTDLSGKPVGEVVTGWDNKENKPL